MPTASDKRILVIKLKQPGDVLVSTPVIAALKEAWPECHLTYLVPKGTEDMVSGHPGLDGLMVVDRRGETWGQALALHPGPQAAALRPGAGALRRRPGRHLLVPHRGPGAARLCPPPAALLAAPRLSSPGCCPARR